MRGGSMSISYKKLWHILLDKDLKKKDLAEMAGVSTYTINKLNRNENVTVEVLAKICRALDCTMDDILEVLDDENEGDKQ
jgi:putative transcriptional regulator